MKIFKAYKSYEKFLKSEKSDYISHSINEIQRTYLFPSNDIENIFVKIKKLFFYLFDNFQLDTSLKDKKTDILIISNLLNYKSLSNDLYFGKLDKILIKQKIKTTKIYRNFLDVNQNNLSSYFKSKQLILGKRLTFVEEIYHLSIAFKEIIIFLFFNKYENIKRYLGIKDFLSIINNLRHVKQINKCIRKLNPKIVVFTFEGHPWERMLNYSIKRFNDNIITVAYQFSIIKRGQVGLFRELKKNYNPDYLATSGKMTYELLKKKIKYAQIFKLGSNKWRKKSISSKKVMLIALDESKTLEGKMLDFCVKFKNIKIVIRLHPLIKNNKKRLDYITKRVSKNNNIFISDKSLKQDLEISKYVLFINSSIAYEALFFNIIPIFFKNNIKPNIFDKNFPKEFVVDNKKTFLNIITKDKEFKKIKYFKKYQDEYFQKYETKKIQELLN